MNSQSKRNHQCSVINAISYDKHLLSSTLAMVSNIDKIDSKIHQPNHEIVIMTRTTAAEQFELKRNQNSAQLYQSDVTFL